MRTFPCTLLALSVAASAGRKRIASDTYKGLNLSLLLVFLARLLLGAKVIRSGVIACNHISPNLFLHNSRIQNLISMGAERNLLAVLSISVCGLGFYRGQTYGKDKPKLLNSLQ